MDKEFLIEEYIKNNKTVKEISDISGKSVSAIRWWLNKLRIIKKTGDLDLIGQRFERLLVVSKTKIKYKSYIRNGWNCKCDCGKTLVVDQGSLRRGATKSCGCYFQEKRFKGLDELSGQQWSRIKHSAKVRGIDFDVSIEYAYSLFIKQDKLCAISNVGINLNRNYKGKISFNTASLDRIDSSKGYVVGNIQWVHKTVNMMKNDMSQQDLIEWCDKISKFNV